MYLICSKVVIDNIIGDFKVHTVDVHINNQKAFAIRNCKDFIVSHSFISLSDYHVFVQRTYWKKSYIALLPYIKAFHASMYFARIQVKCTDSGTLIERNFQSDIKSVNMTYARFSILSHYCEKSRRLSAVVFAL